jgi:WXG100 family type VII secretion target
MTGRIGMDADAVRQSAVQLGNDATSLDQIVGSVDGLVRDMHQHWHGADAQDFHETWTGRHRAELTQLVTALQVFATSARINATAQDLASGVSIGGSGVTSASGFNVLDADVGGVGDKVGTFGSILGSPGLPGRFIDVLSRSGVKSWEAFGASTEDFMTHRGEQISSVFSDLGVKDFGGLAHDLGSGLEVGGNIVAGVGAAVGGVAIGSDLAQGHYGMAAAEGLDTTASILKSSDDPAAYLVGANISIWTDVVKDERQIDWHADYMPALSVDSLTHVYLPGAADGLKTSAGQIWKALT